MATAVTCQVTPQHHLARLSAGSVLESLYPSTWAGGKRNSPRTTEGRWTLFRNASQLRTEEIEGMVSSAPQREPGLTVAELAERINRRKGGMAAALAKLAQAGRVHSQDVGTGDRGCPRRGWRPAPSEAAAGIFPSARRREGWARTWKIETDAPGRRAGHYEATPVKRRRRPVVRAQGTARMVAGPNAPPSRYWCGILAVSRNLGAAGGSPLPPRGVKSPHGAHDGLDASPLPSVHSIRITSCLP